MKIFKRISSIALMLCMVLTMSVTAFAAEMNNSNVSLNDTNEKYTVEVATATREYDKAGNSDVVDIDYIIANSTNVVTRGNEKRGNYTSAKYEAGLTGYTYDISFSWVARVDEEANYFFDEIIDPQVTTYINYVVLSLTWKYYNYKLINNICDVSENGDYVEFNTDYEFTVINHNAFLPTTFTVNNTKIIELENIM